jgi:hypothetical protein
VFSLAHQATGGCYASTVKPFQVALVKPVVYLKTELLIWAGKSQNDGSGPLFFPSPESFHDEHILQILNHPLIIP